MTVLEAEAPPGAAEADGSILAELAAGGDALTHCGEPGCSETRPDTPQGRAQIGLHRWRAHGVRGKTKAKGKPKKAGRPAKAAGAEQAPRPPGERRPGRPPATKARTSLEKLTQFGWGLMARVVDGAGYYPTARMLAIEAPIIGAAVDDTLKGTMADRFLQPAARALDRGTAIGALLVAPACVHFMAVNPASAQVCVPILTECLDEMVPLMTKQIAREARKAADRAEALEGLRPILGVPEGMPVTVEHVIGFLFMPPPEPAAPPAPPAA